MFGYLLAAACLAWVFHDIQISKLLQGMTNIHWGWAALAIVLDIVSYVCQGLRWQLLLQPIGSLTLSRLTQAIYVGLFASEVLPMRLGELARAYLVSRWVPIQFSFIIPSMVVERLLDGVWLALAIGLMAIFFPLPKDLLKAGDILGVIVLIGAGLFLYAVLRSRQALLEHAPAIGAMQEESGFMSSLIGRLARGLQQIGMSRLLYTAFAVSLLLLVFQCLAFWLAMWAYGLPLSLWAGVVVFLIVHLGTAIPNAPGNIGTYQFFCVVGLTLFGVEKHLATGFSVVVFVLLTAPLWAIGFLALSLSGTTLYTIRDGINKIMIRDKQGQQVE